MTQDGQTALETTGNDLASVLSNLSQQMVESVPVSVLRDCLRIVQNECEVLDELTGELSAEKVAALQRSDPAWWSDERVENRRIVEKWKWDNALALADMPEEIRVLRIRLMDARNRQNGASGNYERHRDAANAAQRKYDEACKRLNWSAS